MSPGAAKGLGLIGLAIATMIVGFVAAISHVEQDTVLAITGVGTTTLVYIFFFWRRGYAKLCALVGVGIATMIIGLWAPVEN